jgi:hypothetical protein
LACGGSRERDDDDAWTPPPTTLVERSFLEDGRYEEQLDIDLNGAVDMVIRYRLFGDDGRPVESRDVAMRMSVESRRQVEKQIDANGDGTMDTFRFYEFSGELLREERDADFDGQLERIAHYVDGQLHHVEFDDDGDGLADTERFYREGTLFRVEVDRDANGLANDYYYYVDGSLERRGMDNDENGTIDDWVRRPVATLPGAASSAMSGSPSATGSAPDAAEPSEADE